MVATCTRTTGRTGAENTRILKAGSALSLCSPAGCWGCCRFGYTAGCTTAVHIADWYATFLAAAGVAPADIAAERYNAEVIQARAKLRRLAARGDLLTPATKHLTAKDLIPAVDSVDVWASIIAGDGSVPSPRQVISLSSAHGPPG